MPWREASPMDQRTQFIADYLRDALAITELCEHYGVSRKTGYKWIERYLRHGPAGLEERSRRPRRSPACDILSRHGMVPTRRHRRRLGHPGKPTSQILAPNDIWSADYKGQFRTGDGRYCYPLTVTDGFSRYLLGCQALPSTAADG